MFVLKTRDYRLGIWTIEASYTDDFTTKAKTDFEVKEYGKRGRISPAQQVKVVI